MAPHRDTRRASSTHVHDDWLTRAACGAIVALIALSGPPALAQNYQAAVRGSVRDAAGVVAAADVRLVDEATQLARVTTTNDRGEYVFTNVLPGSYTVGVSVGGYRTYAHTGLRVQTQATVLLDIELEVGSVVEKVTVAGDAPQVDSSLSSVVDRGMLETLPTAGRNVFFAATMTPTVVYSGDPQFVRQQDQSNSSLISLGGGPRRNSEYLLDGVPIVDLLNRAIFIPNMLAVEEMRVQLSAYDAEIGPTSGGVFNLTAKSGTNAWHGEGIYETRPSGTLGRLYFAAKNDIPNPHTYYHLFGGSVGGPVVRNRTFVFASSEGYRTLTTRSGVLLLPTAAERRGDFSQTGFTIYDPITTRPDPRDPRNFIRDPFPGNQIPAGRLNPVALAMTQYLPDPISGNTRPVVAGIVDRADQIMGKVTHRWSDSLTSSGLFAWYESEEPDARFYGGEVFKNGADPGDGALVRSVHLIALNHVWTPGTRTVVAARYGFDRFVDDNRNAAFDPSSLGFDASFLNLVPLPKFPQIGVSDYGRGGALLGDRNRDITRHYSQTAYASVSRQTGRHEIRIGGEYRLTGGLLQNLGGSGGLQFDRTFTSGPDPNAPAAASGDAYATFLLGYPTAGSIGSSVPLDFYQHAWAGFVQDDFRVGTKLTANVGLRYEYEQGLKERQNRMAVGWANDAPFPIQVNGTRPDGSPLSLTGGLLYAGTAGAPDHEGHAAPTQFAPRTGFAYALNDETMVRGGYGLFFAPSQGIAPTTTRGYSTETQYVPTLGNPLVPCGTCSLSNPFPRGLNQPIGNSLGVLTGVGGDLDFADPNAQMGRFQRYSVEVEQTIGRQVSVSLGYLGSRGDHLSAGVGGGGLQINQVDRKYLSLGTALQQPVTNPFYGTPLAAGVLAGPTIPLAQLLRPYPQFANVVVRRPDVGRSRYDALIASARRRFNGRWFVDGNYTWSRLKDNQFFEDNFFSGRAGIPDNYDLRPEYDISLLDTPHHLNGSASIELPWGRGRRWLNRNGVVESLAGGWMVSAVASYQSGFPIAIGQVPNNADLLGNGQRPDIVAGVNPRLSHDYDASCACVRWLNPAAWSQAAPFTFGNAPRTDTRVRTPPLRHFDVAVEKSQRLARSTVAIRAELINVFNFADLRGPSINVGTSSFGQIRDGGGFPRLLQLVARIGW